MPTSEPFTIASVAKTLAEVKALSPADQSSALLRRLAKIYPQVRSSGGLNKGNLLLPGDPYALGAGLSQQEKMPILKHLLGAPWTRLVNEGHLVDPTGAGFFDVSDEGLAAATADATLAPSIGPYGIQDAPTALVSYSWDSAAHKEWVLRLAERLRLNGVNVILDRWDLPLGADRTLFMEQSIHKSDFVLLVCTPIYATKSNNRTGGAGYEAMVITSQLAHQITQNKFIPVLRMGDWDDSAIPIWLQSKIGVDLRGDPYSEEEYELLLRTLHQVQEKAPPLGPKPTFPFRATFPDEGLLGNAVTAVLGLATASVEGLPGPDAPPTNQKQSPIAYAFYDKKGTSDKVHVLVRPVGSSRDLYSIETSGGVYEEGAEGPITLRYLSLDLEMKRGGYTRMQSFNGSGGRRFNLS